MKTLHWPVRAFLFIGVLQLVSCTKSIDTVSKDSITLETSNDLTFPVVNEFADCKLRNIIDDWGISAITYTNGNPISVLYKNGGATGFPEYYFYYDRQGRLKELFQDGFPEARHRYGYDANNRIVTDTLTHFPSSPEISDIYVSTFTYDNQGRIIKENIRNLYYHGEPLKPTRNPTYTYDNRGNLAVAGWKSSSYDNKVSIFRSHPVFQFIFRNYSRNNAAPEAKYNSKGLPTSIQNLNDIFFNSWPTAKIRIGYDCQ
jgi:hypothetical protein